VLPNVVARIGNPKDNRLPNAFPKPMEKVHALPPAAICGVVLSVPVSWHLLPVQISCQWRYRP